MTSAGPPVAPVTSRRRAPSMRLTGAAGALACAGVVVAAAIVSGMGLFVAAAAVVATRRLAQQDRAEQARAYVAITEARLAEDQAHRWYLAQRAAAAEKAAEAHVAALEEVLVAAHQQVRDVVRSRTEILALGERAEAERAELAHRLAETTTLLGEANLRLAEVEQEFDVVCAELNAVRGAARHAARHLA